MEPEELKKYLKIVGIGGGIITAAIVIAAMVYGYKAFLDIRLTKLQITQLESELNAKA